MTRIIQVSTLYQLANVVATIDAGLMGPAEERRILVVANNAYAPEITPAAHEMPGAATLLSRFERVVSWNDTIWPVHPKEYGVSPTSSVMMRALLSAAWELEPSEEIALVVESLPGNPGNALTQIFSEALISVHSDGLMSYGPIRQPLGRPVWQRLVAVHYTDLLPGVEPRQLAEHSPARPMLPISGLRTVLAEMGTEVEPLLASAGLDAPLESCALVLGQYLADINLISVEEELSLHLEMLGEVARRGLKTVVFKVHPTSAGTMIAPLRSRAEALGLNLVIADVPVLAEIIAARIAPELVVSCFSTGLMTIRAMFGVESVAVGTELLLDRLAPYQNSNRIPLTVIDALHSGKYSLPRALSVVDASAESSSAEAAAPTPPTAVGGSVGDPADASGAEVLKPATSNRAPDDPRAAAKGDLDGLIDAVAYCMQPNIMVHLRHRAATFLASAFDVAPGSTPGAVDAVFERRYFKRKRLTSLDLPGCLPQKAVQVQAAQAKSKLHVVKTSVRSNAKAAQQALKKRGISIEPKKFIRRG